LFGLQGREREYRIRRCRVRGRNRRGERISECDRDAIEMHVIRTGRAAQALTGLVGQSGKEFEMTQTKPNRTRNDSANRHEVNNKDSGDQHMLPEFEPEQTPHRPHRLNREDMDKIPRDEGKGSSTTH
jgi:hypothetical protein